MPVRWCAMYFFSGYNIVCAMCSIRAAHSYDPRACTTKIQSFRSVANVWSNASAERERENSEHLQSVLLFVVYIANMYICAHLIWTSSIPPYATPNAMVRSSSLAWEHIRTHTHDTKLNSHRFFIDFVFVLLLFDNNYSRRTSDAKVIPIG